MSIDVIDRFKQKEMKKLRSIKNTCHDWLINYIPHRIRKSVGGFKDKIVNLFNTITPEQALIGRGKKLNKPKTQKQSEENKVNSIRDPFILKKKKKEKNYR